MIGAPRSAVRPSIGMKLPSQSARAERLEREEPCRRRAVRPLDRERRIRRGRRAEAAAIAGPASSARTRRRPQSRDRLRERRRARPACLGRAASPAARAGPACPATYVPAKSSTASTRLAIGPAATIAILRPDALPVECARAILGRDVAFAFVGHLHVAAERNGGQRPLGTIAVRSGATRRRARIRPRSAAP